MQHVTMENPGETREIQFHKGPFKNEPFLPDDFAIVRAVSLNHADVSVPKVKIKENKETLKRELIREEMWVEYACKLLDQELVSSQNTVSWAAYHASQQQQFANIPAITPLLSLLFLERDTPAMVKQGTSLVQTITVYLNPDQIPVLACDQPIFAQCKYIQWKWPGICGENKMIVMLGGLHVEKAFWYSVSDLLAFSGWTEALTEADVATCGTADSFLKVSHITRTRHAHQMTALVLSKLQQDAFDSSDSKASKDD